MCTEALALAGVTQRHALKFAHAFKSHKTCSAHRSISSQIFGPENGSRLSIQNHAAITTGYESCALRTMLCLERKMCVPSRDRFIMRPLFCLLARERLFSADVLLLSLSLCLGAPPWTSIQNDEFFFFNNPSNACCSEWCRQNEMSIW